MLLLLSRITLLGLCLLGGLSLHVFGDKNEFFRMMEQQQARGLLPDGKTRFSLSLTGIEGFDNFANILLLFFWPTVDGMHPDLSLLSFVFAAQSLSAVMLVALEALRGSNAGRLISYPTVTGLIMQSIGFAVIGPLYLFIHLLTTSGILEKHRSLLFISELHVHALPYSLTIGFIVPTIIMSLSASGILTTDQIIKAILLWQVFPLWTAIAQVILTRTIFSSSVATPSATPQLKETRNRLATLYRFAIYVSSGAHIATMALSLSSVLYPGIFAPTLVTSFHPLHLFVPPNPFSDVKAASIAQGAFWFLQFDYSITSAAYLVWAVCLKYSVFRDLSPITLLWDVVGRSLLLGPMAAAANMVWERDEALLNRWPEISERKKQ